MWLGLMGSVPPAFVPPGETEATFLRKILPPLTGSEWPPWEVSAAAKKIWF